MRELHLKPLKHLLDEKYQVFEKVGFTESWAVYMDSCTVMLGSVAETPRYSRVVGANNVIREKLQRIQEQLVSDQRRQREFRRTDWRRLSCPF